MPKEPTLLKTSEKSAIKYTCSCVTFCKGVLREVSKSTHLRHTARSRAQPPTVLSSQSLEEVDNILDPNLNVNGLAQLSDLPDPNFGLDDSLDPPEEPEPDLPDPGCLDETRTEVRDGQDMDNCDIGLDLDDLFESTLVSTQRPFTD
ncbi:hypothetical protein HYPSUDRAFT_202449 [Hypholoma sublateritium FD-334 SS-4]|uniref:Uncharacterized protein n=1 Tax=Hypholoma sublateritium (strain FD-334 SS-4) TaxID=945553 RepID=A0A0D2PQW0_HYPSF|nr:hypothetical protein HYPSUDRAFT_202449 [Hypholoma sublateritium FD-334 SS-4]